MRMAAAALCALATAGCLSLGKDGPEVAKAPDPFAPPEAAPTKHVGSELLPMPGGALAASPDVAASPVLRSGPVTATAVAVRPAAVLRGVAEPLYMAELEKAALQLDESILRDCKGPRAVRMAGVERLTPSDAALAALTSEDGFVYRERVEVLGCRAPRKHALYPVLSPKGKLGFSPGLPGESVASLKLQLDALRQTVATAVGIVVAGQPKGKCDPMATSPWVVDTVVSAPPEDGKWGEVWTITACGEMRVLPMMFTQTPTGAQFSAQVDLAAG